MASVNGRALRFGDVVPVESTNASQPSEISRQTMQFFLKRAIDRELIFQTARERGVTVDEGQNQQLAAMAAERNIPEPGGIARLNASAVSREFEMRDARAFQLQTALMAAQGSSPDVTETEALDYYHQHQTEFGELPADPAARKQAWSDIDFQIREQLAFTTRSNYNLQLAAFMGQLESRASIVVSPAGDAAGAN